jgi:FkbM family methyltransferase
VSRQTVIDLVVDGGLWGDSDLCLLDVGASGGIHKRWSLLGSRLTAVGFDPLVAEVDRLNRLETRPKVRYEASRVSCHDYDSLFPPSIRNDPAASRFNQPFHRSSAAQTHAILKRDYVQEVFNSGATLEYSSRTITLDDYVASLPQLRPDFLKVDTDGSDYPVLLGASRLIESGTLLGLAVETQFHGAVHDFANCFCNIDRFLRQRGFSLFDLPPQRYSRVALPAPFVSSIPAQTMSGQVGFAEAVYFRDLAAPSYERMFGFAPTRERVLKLLCLFVLHGFNDCAAELLVTSDALAGEPARGAILDALTPRIFGDRSYEAFIARFNAAPLSWPRVRSSPGAQCGERRRTVTNRAAPAARERRDVEEPNRGIEARPR